MTHHCRTEAANWNRNVNGFTLIELLVAVTIFALTAMASWRGIDMVLRTNSRIEAQEQSIESIEKTFAQLDVDMSNLPEFSYSATNQEMGAQADRFVFVRSQNSASEPYSRYQVVAYIVQSSTFYRITSPAINQYRDVQNMTSGLQNYVPASNDKSNYYEVALVQDIDHFTVNYFCNQSWVKESNCFQIDEENGTNPNKKNQKPKAIRLVLHTLNTGNYEKTSIINL
jgi:general secretion pathway protein J